MCQRNMLTAQAGKKWDRGASEVCGCAESAQWAGWKSTKPAYGLRLGGTCDLVCQARECGVRRGGMFEGAEGLNFKSFIAARLTVKGEKKNSGGGRRTKTI